MRLRSEVLSIASDDEGFTLELNGMTVAAKKVVIATGGLSMPGLGASPLGYKIAEQFGLDVLPTRAGLVPFTLHKPLLEQLQVLSGVSVPAVIAAQIPDVSLKQLNAREQQALIETLTEWRVQPNGTEGYRTAEVTLGGVNTDELSSRTMEARKVPGLYFIGEVMDVTGWLGGYNFQWAWSSAWACAQALSEG